MTVKSSCESNWCVTNIREPLFNNNYAQWCSAVQTLSLDNKAFNEESLGYASRAALFLGGQSPIRLAKVVYHIFAFLGNLALALFSNKKAARLSFALKNVKEITKNALLVVPIAGPILACIGSKIRLPLRNYHGKATPFEKTVYKAFPSNENVRRDPEEIAIFDLFGDCLIEETIQQRFEDDAVHSLLGFGFHSDG